MGGRGSTSGIKTNANSVSTKNNSIMEKVNNTQTKYTVKQLDGMKRSKLEEIARAIFVRLNVSRGLTPDEADYRARSLMDGNTTAQLKKYIKKNG